MHLLNEVWTLVLVQISRDWEERWKLAKVCKTWRNVICHFPWEEALPITNRRAFPPFYNSRYIRIECDVSPELMLSILKRFTNIRCLEFGMFSSLLQPQPSNIMKYIEQFQLEEIVIGTANNWLTSQNLHCLASCTSCNLANCLHISDDDIKYLGNCISLNISLPVMGSSKEEKLTDTNFSILHDLTRFDMAGRKKISDEGVKHLTKLKSLRANHCNLTGSSFRFLQELEHLSYHRCSLLDCSNLSYLNLKSIDLTRSSISNEDLQHIGSTQEVTLSYCTGISGKGLSFLTKVETLNLEGCKQLVDNAIKHISLTCCKVSLRACNKLTDKTLEYLPFVQLLNVKSCPKISFKAIQQATQTRNHQSIVSDFDHRICPG